MLELKLSNLPKTWIFDIDGTLVVHNGYLQPQGDEILPGVTEFFNRIPPEDKVILMTARNERFRLQLENFLFKNGIRFDKINDRKPSGLKTAFAVNKDRNSPFDLNITIDETL